MEIHKAEFVTSSVELSQCPESSQNEYAFIGRSNVGKSSLINMLTGYGKLAKISASPGKTQTINHFQIDDTWMLVDLPGYGFAKINKGERKKWETFIRSYITGRQNLVTMFVLIDSRHLPQKIDLEFMEWLGIRAIPFSIIFTKIDKLSSSALNKNLTQYKKELLKKWEELPRIFTTSSASKLGRDELLQYIGHLNEKVKL